MRPWHSGQNRRLSALATTVLSLALLQLACGGAALAPAPTATRPTQASAAGTPPGTLAPTGYHFARLADPARTQVTDGQGRWLATFTDGAYTVTLLGPQRTFTETTAGAAVITTTWVRVLPAPFAGKVDDNWLAQALTDRSPDVLAIAMQYLAGAPPIVNAQGLQIAGKASYGPVADDDTREEGGDFSDYLGVPWTFNGITHAPKADFFRSLDCSGFMRMVWGYRGGLPLSYAPDGGASLPRHSWEMLASAPGVVLYADTNDAQLTDFSKLSTGDLVFFHAKAETHTPQIDHVGLFLGRDTAGHYRFISSRQKIDGPTLGDYGGASLLDGSGLYARSYRAARRL